MRTLLRTVVVLIFLQVVFSNKAVLASNPADKVFTAPPDVVFKAAIKAASAHRVSIINNTGLKQLNDAGEEIKKFTFPVSLSGVSFQIIAEVSVEPTNEGNAKLELYFSRDRRGNPYVPSDEYQLREAQLKAQLEARLSELATQEQQYEIAYEGTHSINLETYMEKRKDIRHLQADAQTQELEQEKDAMLLDLAGMPNSSFPTMDAAAEKYFGAVEQNLKAGPGKAGSTPQHLSGK